MGGSANCAGDDCVDDADAIDALELLLVAKLTETQNHQCTANLAVSYVENRLRLLY